MDSVLFTGACTALVTPFLGKAVNYPLLDRLLARQIDAGISAVVLCGTTGESATLTDAEKLAIIGRGKAFVRDRCTVIAGTGSNDTEHTVNLSRLAEQAGADALLVVTPYYNKATPGGLLEHYRAVAAGARIPVIIYNVPSRTGVDIPVEVCQALAAVPNIAGIKEASSDISRVARLRAACPDSFAVWGGNDDQAAAVLSLGGSGVISVVSNLYPELMQALVSAGLDGDFDTAADLQLRLLPLIRALFREVNPIPAKAAMELLGWDCGRCRLPLTRATEETVVELKKLLPREI